MDADVKRTKKWLEMIKEWDGLCETSRVRDPIANRIRVGVPDIVHGKVWNLLGGGDLHLSALDPMTQTLTLTKRG
jgi:hypothetical protein